MTNPSDNLGSSTPEAPGISPQVTELLARTAELLALARDRSVETLRGFTDLELQPDQAYACFELFQGQDYGVNYNEFFVSDGNVEVEYNPMHDSEESFLPELGEFLEGYLADNPERLDSAASTQFSELHAAQLYKWFSECWLTAGGGDCQVPTYFAFEKEYKVRDLVTGEIMSEAEAARRLGFDVTK